jgi:adenine-specific DNA-methyltransferase
VNYIGSKQSLLPFIEDSYRQVAGGDERTFCDLFAGTGAVGRHFKRRGLRVIANDIQYYAYVLNKAYLEIDTPPRFTNLREQFRKEIEKPGSSRETALQKVLTFCNALPGKPGFITRHYSPAGSRFYYSTENAEKADAIRASLERWRAAGILSEKEYFYLLGSLLEAIDKVANTASVYGAFLIQFKKSAKRPLQLKPLELSNQVSGCKVFRDDANAVMQSIRCDVLYLDPPYNHRQYGANYHVLETIAAYDSPEITGVTGMRTYTPSQYCRQKAAKNELENLIASARARHIFVSYNDEGIMSLDEVQGILRLRGRPRLFSTAYNRFKADNGRLYKRKETIEYLHYVGVTQEA